jgi:hypothetical protein
VQPRKHYIPAEGDTLAAGTAQERMAVAEDNRRLVVHTLAVVDRTEAANMAHLQGDNHLVVGSATEDRLDSLNKVFDRSYVWFLP